MRVLLHACSTDGGTPAGNAGEMRGATVPESPLNQQVLAPPKMGSDRGRGSSHPLVTR